MKKYEKYFIINLCIFSIFSLYFAFFSSLTPDEGTHLLLSIFYHDLFSKIENIFSFENAWNYGLEYLIHYPKLQIVYPPVYHFLTAFLFLFWKNEIVGRIINIILYLLTSLIIFKIAQNFLNSKAALISALSFLSYFYVFRYSFIAQQDMSVYFFTLLSFYFFILILLKEKYEIKYFFILGIICALAALSKQMGGFTVIVYSLIFLLRKKLKNILFLFVGFLIIITPYLFILSKIGGFEISVFQGFLYAFSQGEPTSYLDPELWIWYVFKPSLIYPPLLFFLAVFTLYVIRKEKLWKELVIFFIVFYLGLSIILNKEPRFSTFFMIPAFFAFGKFFERKWKVAIAILASFFLLSFSLTLTHSFYFPVEEIIKLFEKQGNIAYFGEGGNNYLPFSSVIMWKSRIEEKYDIQSHRYHFRSCNFNDLTSKNDILASLRKKSVRYILVYPNSPVNIFLIKDNIKLLKEINYKNSTLKIYEFLNYSKSNEFCNKICLTSWEICEKNGRVFLIK